MSKENRNYYIRNGRCPRCGGKHLLMPGRYTCRECAEKDRKYQREQRAFRRENGLCTRCGKPLPDGSAYVQCDDCRAYMRKFDKFNKSRYEGLKADGKCVKCGAWAEPGRTLCKRCSTRHAAYVTGYGDEYRQKKRQRRQARIDAGLCYDCGRPVDDGHTRCPRCREMRMDSSRKYKILQKTRQEAENARRVKNDV